MNTTLDDDDIKKVNLYTPIVYGVFRFLEKIIEIRNVNYPKIENKVIFAMWHSDQCCLHGIPKEKRGNVNVLISKSVDGEIIARVVEKWGFKTIRGSENKNAAGYSINKGGSKAALGMIEKLNNDENVAIMVDGPRGPLHKVKNGIINAAKHTGATIIPVIWYSLNRSFLQIPSWDKMTFPLGFTKVVNLYGDPITVPKDATKEDEEKIKEQIKQSLLDLGKKAPDEWNKVFKK